MANYLFISSRDPYESSDSADLLDLVRDVKARNNSATLFLVQNGVLGVRQGARHSDCFQRLAQAGVAVLADSFSLRERAVAKLADGVRVSNIDRLVDLLVEPGTKAIWR
jgi:sulfur relay (sulfurtransferase) DsrF/TusC family protein